jgi:hypothetical protein
MITITHKTAILTVQPENAESTRELLALIDKSKGRKGRKLPKDKGNPKLNSMSRFYPAFHAGMTTTEYVKLYALQNDRLHLAEVNYEHADRPAPMLDPSIPEVEELPCEQ